jgi:hypothetical protein
VASGALVSTLLTVEVLSKFGAYSGIGVGPGFLECVKGMSGYQWGEKGN